MSEIFNINVKRLRLKSSNLYSNGIVIQYDDNQLELSRDEVDWVGEEDDEIYQIKEDDELDKIAWDYFKDQVESADKWWWVIADCNKEIDNPMDLSGLVGSYIRIPNILSFVLITSNNENSILSD